VITLEQARDIARNEINPKTRLSILCMIIEEATIEREGCWVFFYQSAEYIATQRWESKVVGNAPILVRKSDGTVFPTGTANPTEYYIKNFEETGDTAPLY